MPTCSLCRVEDTPDHQQSGFHRFNSRLFSEGKMPITEENYNKFEKQREESGEDGNKTQHIKDVPNHNVNKWHWEEKPFTSWATTRIKQLSREKLNLPLTVDSTQYTIHLRVKDIKGDAYLNNRKGRVFGGFLFDCRYHIRTTIGDEIIYGTCLVPDIANDDIDEITITDIKLETGSTSSIRDKIMSIVRREMKKEMIKLFESFLKEFKYYEKHPHESPPELEYIEDTDDAEYKKEKKSSSPKKTGSNSESTSTPSESTPPAADELSASTTDNNTPPAAVATPETELSLNTEPVDLPPGSTPTTPPPLEDIP